jgi:hypothetical protein
MARIGLRMMPTFPSSPLKFRTAGFPQYGFKAGISGRLPSKAPTCRALSVCFPPSCPPLQRRFSAQCRNTLCAQAPPFKRLRRSTPGALAPVRVILSRSIITYPAPSDPLAGTARFHCSAAYTHCLRCAFPPRRPATGSVLSPLILSQHVVLCDSGESGGCIHPVPSPPTLAFVPLVQTRHSHTSHKSVSRGGHLSKLHYGSLALQPADLFTLLTDRTGFASSPRGFLLPGFRRVGRPLRRRLSLLKSCPIQSQNTAAPASLTGQSEKPRG